MISYGLFVFIDSRNASQGDSATTTGTGSSQLAGLTRANMEINTASKHGSISDALRAPDKGMIDIIVT